MANTFKNPTERMIEQFGRVIPTTEQQGRVEIVRQKYVDLANELVANVPGSAEFTVALRKLMESKDAAIRAILFPQ